MSDAKPHPPAWHPDPRGRHQFRWWDGTAWTDNVSSNGVAGLDPVAVEGHLPAGNESPDQVRQQIQSGLGATSGAQAVAGTSLLDQPLLVVNQKARFIELENEYAVYDANGHQVAAVRQVGQSTTKKVMRALTSFDQFMTHTLQVVDATGRVQMVLTRPAKFVKSRLDITDGDGAPIGQVVQQNVFGKIKFSLEVGGHAVGSINAENWRAWNFSIRDAADQEVARITKTWEGLTKTLFTTADNYVVVIHRPLQEPLRRLVVASALCVDTALKQDNRGFN